MLMGMLKHLSRIVGSSVRVQSTQGEASRLPADLRGLDLAAAHAWAERAESGQDLDAAVDFCAKAVAAFPADPKLRLIHANVLTDLGRCQEAHAEYQAALAIAPGFTAARFNLGVLLQEMGAIEGAIGCFEDVVEAQPDAAHFRLNLALARLAVGDLERGWRDYAVRFDPSLGSAGARLRRFSIPVWRGEPLAGKRLVVWGEQGLGDQMVFAAMYPELLARAGGCVIECTRKLVPLFARSFPAATVVPIAAEPSAAAADADYQCAAGDLARWLRPSLSAFPAESVFLRADPERVAHWRRQLDALGSAPKVGICWRSSNASGLRALACTDITQWGLVLSLQQVQFVNLQYDKCSEELARAESLFGVRVHRAPGVDLFDDLLETSALMCALDLVISAPTLISVHAAALGVPTWQLSCGTDWHCHGTANNPWLPALTRFHRGHDQGWGEILEAVASELSRWVSKR
jgi:tetratricopeptide (TPR) repeat protein